jgi:hypothetical protein
MDLVSIQGALARLFTRERTRFDILARTETQALEIGALTLVVEHYRRAGWAVEARNLQNELFRTKLTSAGKPWNFSWFSCARGQSHIEVHANLPVKSATPLDDGTYVVDVAVVSAGQVDALRLLNPPRRKINVSNDQAISFVEAKKLVIYPMLLAQFVGMVHEIKPEYLQPAPASLTEAESERHILPALVSIGPISITSTSPQIIAGFEKRGFRLNVVPTFDQQILDIIDDPAASSPFRTDLRSRVPPSPATPEGVIHTNDAGPGAAQR